MHRATTKCYKARGRKAGEGIKGSSCVSGNRYPEEIGHEAVTVSWLHGCKAVGLSAAGVGKKPCGTAHSTLRKHKRFQAVTLLIHYCPSPSGGRAEVMSSCEVTQSALLGDGVGRCLCYPKRIFWEVTRSLLQERGRSWTLKLFLQLRNPHCPKHIHFF